MNRSRTSKILLLALTLSSATLTATFAGGVKTTDPLVAPFLSRPITIDGSLDDWPEARSSRVNAFPSDLASKSVQSFAKYPALGKGQAEVVLTHDRDNLYLGLRLPAVEAVVNTAKAPESWHNGGDGIIVNARDADGKSFSVLWWGVDKKGAPRVAVRRDGGPWQDMGPLGGKAALRSEQGKGSAAEIMIPWSALGRTDAGATRLDLVWEAAFNGITLDVLKDLPQEIRGTTMHSSRSVLTVPEKQGTMIATWLTNPAQWGKLRFGDSQATPGATLETAKGVGLSEWTVPKTAKPIQIDGKMDDWPKEWLVSAAPAPWAYGDRYRTDIGMAWDAERLYLVFRFHNNGQPMHNTEIAANRLGYSGGDNVQIRLKIGDKVTHLCGWYDSNNKTPALTDSGKDRKEPNLLAVGASEAFAALPDGSGYVQEISIPFKELMPAPPAVGDIWQATFQLWSIGFDERFSVETHVDFVSPPPLQTRYKLPRNADISLGLFDPQGRLLRQIVLEEPRVAGVNVEAWDGLDQWGKVIPPGDYLLKGIHYERLKNEYIMTATSPGTPPWPTADGKGDWFADWQAPQAVVTDGETVYVAAPHSEQTAKIIAIGPDGKRLWGVKSSGTAGRCVSLALIGDRLYAIYTSPERPADGTVRGTYQEGDKTIERGKMVCYDKRTGELAGPSVKSGKPITFATWDFRDSVRGLWDLRLNKSFSPATYGGRSSMGCSGMGETTGALGLAAVGNRLVASLFYSNELVVLDPDTVGILKRIPLDAPVGLHGIDGKSLLAVSGKKLVKVDIESGAVKPVITGGLSAPYGVTTDKDGNIYVSDWGDSFQVKKFSPAGKPLLAIGKPGGRPWVGKWEADGMLVPRGIAVTNAGKLWVAEDDKEPKRLSVWDSGSGALIRDFIGSGQYAGSQLAIDPKDPQRIITCGTEFKLDFEKKTYTPVSKVFLRRSRDDVFTPDGNAGCSVADQIRYRDGKEFYVHMGFDGHPTILQRQGDEYRPVASVRGFPQKHTIDGTQKIEFDSGGLGYQFLPNFYPEFFKGKQNRNLIWNDLNGDNLVQENECEWDDGKKGVFASYWGQACGPDWAIYMAAGNTIYRFDPEFDANGLPRYSWNRCRPVVENILGGISSVFVSASGQLYVTIGPSGLTDGKVQKAMICYDREGRELWSIPKTAEKGPKAVYGKPRWDVSYPGMGSAVLTWVWWHNGRMYLLGEDGLIIAGLSFDNGRGLSYEGGESNSFAQQAPDGRLFLVNGKHSAHHFFELKGLETAQRFEQPLKITQADADAAARTLAVGVPKEKEQPVVLVRRTAAPAADKGLEGWNLERDGVELTTSRKSGRGGRIALSTDGKNLYIAARILDETPMVNKGSDWQTAFMYGDCLDLMLATDPKADPKRKASAPGDLRLLFTELNGKPQAVLYRPVVPGAENRVQMMATFIDEVTQLPADCAPVITREKDAYVLTAKVPLATLGLESLPGELRGDVGVIYGDASGRNRDQRLYYYNKETWMVDDLTTEATLQPGNWGPLLIELPGNLSKNPGFEADLAADSSQGWAVTTSRNGAVANVTNDGVFAGRQALLFEQQTLLKPPADVSKIKGRSEYGTKMNDGKGGGYVIANQRIPVTGGQKYDLRFAIRAEGMVPIDWRGSRHDNTYLKFEILWVGPKGGLGGSGAGNYDTNIDTWRQVFNPGGTSLEPGPMPYTAPADATHAEIRLHFIVNSAAQPKVWIDQMEFAPARENK